MTEHVYCPCCEEQDWVCEGALFLSEVPDPPKLWWVFSNGRAIYAEKTEEEARRLASEWRVDLRSRGLPEPTMAIEHTVYPPSDPRGHGWVPSSAAVAI